MGVIFCFWLFACQGFAKEWKTSDGTSVHGDFLRSDAATVTIRIQPGGNLVILSRAALTPETRQFLVLLEKYRSEMGLQSWPGQMTLRGDIRLTGGPNTYHSAHFQILRGGADRTTVFRLATVMEDALAAISKIPNRLELKPPAPATYFQVRFMERAQFDRDFKRVDMQVQLPPGVRVKGAYIASVRELWLPFDLNSETLESLAPTVVHEVCHQSMHDWLPLLPEWFNEGFAEYMATIPYQYRTFQFDRSWEGLIETMREGYQTGLGPVQILHPGRLLDYRHQWTNSPREYLSALLIVYFLVHLDGSGNGESLGRYIGEVARFRNHADTMLSDLRKIADSYNSKVESYRREMDDYQRKLSDAKSELLSGKRVFLHSKDPGRLIIGGTPAIPALPQQPGDPPLEIIGTQRERTFNFITIVNQRALLALLSARNIEEFAAQMKAAFEAKGMVITFL